VLDRELLLVCSVVGAGAIMATADATIVNVAIETLTRDLNAPLVRIQWVVIGYTLAFASVIPLAGWAADRFGTKRLYAAAIGLFMAGSLLCGRAWDAESLIAFRVLQGAGAGLLLPVGTTIVIRAAGPRRVGRVVSITNIPAMLGPILGPVVGGAVIDTASWQWIFYVNVPIGAVALLLAIRLLPRDAPESGDRLDRRGLLLLSPGLAALIYGLAESSAAGGVDSARALMPMLAGAGMLVLFAIHALRIADPLVDVRLLADRTFATASATLLLVVIAQAGSALLLPLYLQTVREESAMHTGLLLAPLGIGTMLALPVAGALSDRTGVGRVVPCGLAIVALSVLGLTQLTPDTSYWLIGSLLLVNGVGMGLTAAPAVSGALQVLRRAAVARGSTAIIITTQIGASFGTALVTAILSRRLGSSSPGAGLDPALPEAATRTTAAAFAGTFWFALAIVVAALLVALRLPKRPPVPMDEPAFAAQRHTFH
jgi:EmrB/QacA subfamily drug resistance transporter